MDTPIQEVLGFLRHTGCGWVGKHKVFMQSIIESDFTSMNAHSLKARI